MSNNLKYALREIERKFYDMHDLKKIQLLEKLGTLFQFLAVYTSHASVGVKICERQ